MDSIIRAIYDWKSFERIKQLLAIEKVIFTQRCWKSVLRVLRDNRPGKGKFH